MENNKKRIVIILVSGVAAIAATLYLLDPNAFSPSTSSVSVPALPPASVTGTPAPAVIGATTPVLPKGTEIAGQVLRDIFSPPAGYAALLPAPAGSDPARSDGGRSFAAGPVPVLTGVISGDGSKVVILRQGTLSRSYRIGQAAGAYTVAAIGTNSVTLRGPAGTTILTMGQ